MPDHPRTDTDLGTAVPRPARTEDLAEVLALLRSASLPIEGVPDAFPDSYSVVDQGPALVGVAGLEIYGRFGLLRSVVVTPALRDRGLGERLVWDRLEVAQRHGLEAVYLLTTSAADYFERLGFAPLPRPSAPASLQQSAEFASICPASAICLVKRIGSDGVGPT